MFLSGRKDIISAYELFLPQKFVYIQQSTRTYNNMIENESHDRKYLTTIQVNKLRKSRFTAKFCFISQFIVDLSQYRWHENIEQQSRSACSENRDSLQNHVSFQNLSWLCQSIVDMFLSIYPMGGHWHRDCFCFWRFASVQRIICL